MKLDLDQSTALLLRTPRVLRELLAGLADAWTTPDYGPGTWSAKEIVAHYIFGERTDWVPRLRIILEHGEARRFEPFDRSGHKELLARHTLAELLAIFERERAEGLAALRAAGLTHGDLARAGTHPALGRVTLGNLLAAWVVHDLNHIAQIAKALAYQYKAEVGPWEAYLSILAPPNPR